MRANAVDYSEACWHQVPACRRSESQIAYDRSGSMCRQLMDASYLTLSPLAGPAGGQTPCQPRG